MANSLAKQEKKAPIILLERFSVGFSMITDEQAGRIIKAVYSYRFENKEPDFKNDVILKFFWLDIKNWLDESQTAYMEKCEKNRENISKRWNKDKSE